MIRMMPKIMIDTKKRITMLNKMRLKTYLRIPRTSFVSSIRASVARGASACFGLRWLRRAVGRPENQTKADKALPAVSHPRENRGLAVSKHFGVGVARQCGACTRRARFPCIDEKRASRA
jgi:hypothetical protein